MQIKLQQVIPVFIEKEKTDPSQVWGHDIVFSGNENVQIVAPSGSGKTSLAHFLYGLRNDYTGTILYDTTDIRDFDAEKFSGWRQQHISVIFQDLRLFAEQTVFENINIKRVLAPYHAEDKIQIMAERLGIGNKLSKPLKTCSYGEQQRIAIIRSLMQPFDFLFADEPFSHLDENNRIKAMELIQEETTARKAGIILSDLKQLDFFDAAKILNL
ncbi:MAG: ATP-binding cassette domain-containing protein [Ferruginibacter sp.]